MKPCRCHDCENVDIMITVVDALESQLATARSSATALHGATVHELTHDKVR